MNLWSAFRSILSDLAALRRDTAAILANQAKILKQGETIMANQADLDAAISTLEGEETTLVKTLTDIAAELKALQGQPAPDLSPQIARITALSNTVAAAIAANPDPTP